ncbi:MAG: GNAT family N-acetyltransferase [Clostridia bacterium]|nr:GNAT family N-acetyltransferase [Clostridia bacterium]
MAQLKMYWFTSNELEELTLPEGYSFSHFSEKNRDVDIHDWNECIRTWEESDETDEERFKQEIYDFKDIVPEEDVWFLDYNGEHIGTSTSFIMSENGHGDMHWVGIKKEFRGKGLSKYLTNIIMKTLKERGADFVSLTTGEGRPAAVKAYLTAGFLPVEYDEGMVERWEKVLKTYNIDKIQMLNEDGTPFKVIYKAE